MNVEQYRKLLNQKLDVLLKILETTRHSIIFGEGDDDFLEDEAEKFSALYERRETDIAAIREIDTKLDAHGDLYRADDPLHTKIRETAGAILALDKTNMDVYEKLKVFVKRNLKTVRDGQGIANKYNDFQGLTSGHYYDSVK